MILHIPYTYCNTSCCKTIIQGGNVILIYLFVPTDILIFEICFRGIGESKIIFRGDY